MNNKIENVEKGVEKGIEKKQIEEIEEMVFNAIVQTMRKQSKTTIIVKDQGYYDYVIMRRPIKVHYRNYIVYIYIEAEGGGKPVTAVIQFVDPITYAGTPETISGSIQEIAEKVARYIASLEPAPRSVKILKCDYVDII
jgi:hypothetical protein